MRRVAISVVAILALAFQPGSVRASQQHIVDDPCFKSHSGGYFWLGGPLSGWYIHQGSGVNNCHLYNWTEGTGGLPVNWANYALPTQAAFNGQYDVFQMILCHHNAPRYKYYIYANGTGGGVTGIYTTGTHLGPCDGGVQVLSNINFCATCGGYLRLVDNVAVAAEPQNADWLLFNP